MEVIKGIPVAPGVAIGRAFVLEDVLERVPYHALKAEDVQRQLGRLERAIELAKEDLGTDRDRAAETLGSEPAKIFEFHLGLLADAALIEPIRQTIEREHVTAEYAVAKGFRALADRFRSMESDTFRQKANDVMDLDRRLIGRLMGRTEDRLAHLEEPVIVIAHELTPAQAASFDTAKVRAFATDAGGRTSHTSIVAAALGIPVVVGCTDLTRRVGEGEEVVIDGKGGVVIVNPEPEVLEQYRRDQARNAHVSADLAELALAPSVTLDGTRIQLMGNIEFAHEIDMIRANGGDGVGLFRTEFLFLTTPHEPTEEEQFEEFKKAVELMEGMPITFRTFDLGADKYTQARAEEPERNPFLGLRSIRYCLRHLSLFRRHLRAVIRASAHGRIKVMFPLISTALELRQAKMILQDVMDECEEEGIEFDRSIPIGMMVEVPSAALTASIFASTLR